MVAVLSPSVCISAVEVNNLFLTKYIIDVLIRFRLTNSLPTYTIDQIRELTQSDLSFCIDFIESYASFAKFDASSFISILKRI